jgi:hypothetical protein
LSSSPVSASFVIFPVSFCFCLLHLRWVYLFSLIVRLLFSSSVLYSPLW